MQEFDKAETAGARPESWEDVGFFVGFVLGVYDAHEAELADHGALITRKQVCTIVSAYLKKHPEQWHQSGHDIVLRALKEAFPKRPR
jgi:hypothetical protein